MWLFRLLILWGWLSLLLEASITPSSIGNVCPGDTIELTCLVGGSPLRWTLPSPSGGVPLITTFIGSDSSLVGMSLPVPGDTLGVYTINLDAILMDPTRLMSTLEVRIFTFLDGQAIQCSGSSVTIQLYDRPRSPQNLRISQSVNNTFSSTVTIQWNPPQTNGGATVDNYTVSITPAPLSGDSISTMSGTQTDLILHYNVEYTVEVVARNCAGSSNTPSVLTFTLDFVTAPLTTSYSEVGRPCPNEIVMFTCRVDGADLIWDPSDVSPINVNSQTPLNTPVSRGEYSAVLISNSPMLVSVLTTSARDGITVECRSPLETIGTETVQLASIADPPVNVSHSVQSSTTNEAVVSVQWDLPDNNGGRDDLNYTVNISPATTQLSATVVTSTTVTVTADYNEDYTINIVATNCAGNSTAVEYMFRVERMCPMLMNTSNGVIGPGTNRSVGATVTLQCDPGFMSTGPMTATCMDTLMWLPDLGTFQCIPLPTTPPILCDPPQSPVNGSLGSRFPSSPLGTTVTFQCDDGLFPTDVRTATCRDMSGRGEWEPNPADLVCRETTDQGNHCPSACTGIDVAISVVVTFIVSVLIGLSVGVLGTYLFMRDKVCKQNGPPSTASTNPPPPQEQPPPPGPVYEEVSTPKENIELETNLAYGPVRQ